jgi:hypothetical protein
MGKESVKNVMRGMSNLLFTVLLVVLFSVAFYAFLYFGELSFVPPWKHQEARMESLSRVLPGLWDKRDWSEYVPPAPTAAGGRRVER